MENESNHLFVTKTEAAKENFNFKVEAEELLLDLKVLLKEYYAATFTADEKSLNLCFNNGQKFILTINEQK